MYYEYRQSREQCCLIYEMRTINDHKGNKIDKSKETEISGKEMFKVWVYLVRSDGNSRKIFHSGALEGKTLIYHRDTANFEN